MQPTIITQNLLKLASGDDLALQIYQFKGSTAGKKVYIQSNLHGAEIVGNAVIHQLIQDLSQLDPAQLVGEIWLVPACNPLATNQRSHFFSTGRFNSYDGINWNRIFWDYEKECLDLAQFAQSQLQLNDTETRQNFLAKIQQAFQKQKEKIDSAASVPFREQYRYQLQSLCLDANYIIDIHSSSNRCLDYLYCVASREESGSAFGLDYGILMTQYDGDAFDEAFIKPWLALEKALMFLGKFVCFDVEAYTLELGSGMEMNPASVQRGVNAIKRYLTYKNVVNLPTPPVTQLTQFFPKQQMQPYYAPTGGMVQNRLPLKHPVKVGDRLYQILSFNKTGELPTVKDIFSEHNGFIWDVGINEAVNQGEYVLEVMVESNE
ncbi:MAG: succinylglutamate desuccinylase/aspartoacylase family protein [Snowella sp.]|nr:succinylglutamate desuccinylase/aspartoacylase family protein [Snowella sp.]